MNKKPENAMLKKIMLLSATLGVVAFMAISTKLFYMQVIKHDYYLEKATSQQTRDKIITPNRGTIYDANMKPLALSASTEMITIEPVRIKDDAEAQVVSQRLAEILNMDYETIYAKATKKSAYQVIKKGVEKEDADKVRELVQELGLKCVYPRPDSKRYYPFGNFLSQVLGFVGGEQQGLDGLEAVYDKELTGTPGRIVTATNVDGEEMPFAYEMYHDAIDGYDLVLTIDEVVQHYLEKNLELAFLNNKIQENVTGIVMDIKTGGILAMSSKPDFDPNEPFVITDEKVIAEIAALADDEKKAATSKALSLQWRNKAVSDTYEPGSTFKILTTAMALEENTANEQTTYYCSGSAMVTGWGKPIGCWKLSGHGSQTLIQAVQNSCNPAFIAIGQSVGIKDFSKYFTGFGLTQKTGIDAPGEAVGIYHKEAAMKEIDLATSSFGQTFQITPIQLITAISAVANGGKLMTPHIVKEVLDGDGNVVQSFEKEPVRQVISEETSKRLCAILESVVSQGTGKNAYLPGYRVAGKTGTSEKKAKQALTGRNDLRISSFAAFAPADDPQVAILILLDEPTVYPVTGGVTAAPVVRKVLEETLPYLGVEPVYSELEMSAKEVSVPTFVGLTPEQADNTAKRNGFVYRKVGSGDTVTDQMPVPGASVPSSAEIVLYMGEPKPEKTVAMPDLVGMNYDTAKRTLKNLDMFISTKGMVVAGGNLVVREQSVAAGTEIAVGSVVRIDLSDLDQAANNT